MKAPTNAGRRAGERVPRPGADLLANSRRVGEDFVALTDAALHVVGEWRALLGDQLDRRPYAMLAAAAGVGYVLGGGVPVALVRLLIGIGGRIAVERAIAGITRPDSAEG